MSQKDLSIKPEVEALEKLMFQLSWAEHRRIAHELVPFHLTVPQYMALRAMQLTPQGSRMSDLAEATGQVSATMTGIIDRLSERGLADRRPDLEDRRVLRVFITEAGRSLLNEIAEQKRSRMQRILSSLSPKERQDMMHILQLYLNITMTELEEKPHEF